MGVYSYTALERTKRTSYIGKIAPIRFIHLIFFASDRRQSMKMLNHIYFNFLAATLPRAQAESRAQPAQDISSYFPPEAREEVLTVLFLDIIGFSAAVLTRSPAEAFRDLKMMFDRMTRLVQQHGGTVDRTLGDGLLAYFTANDSSDIPGTHADRAILCGVAIHHTQINGILVRGESAPITVLPIRVGINSGTVYMGDLGNEERRDFTIIGSAVNLGQRLESACEINRVMIGLKTLELAENFSETTPGMRARPIIAKSYQEPVNAFEFDPFLDDSEATKRFITAYRAFAQRDRVEDRIHCEEASLFMVTNHGHALVVNVSRSGVMLRFDKYIARGVVVYVSQVVAKVEHLDTPPMFLEVRWGSPDVPGNYMHGCLLKNLNEDQKNELWELWAAVLIRT